MKTRRRSSSAASLKLAPPVMANTAAPPPAAVVCPPVPIENSSPEPPSILSLGINPTDTTTEENIGEDLYEQLVVCCWHAYGRIKACPMCPMCPRVSKKKMEMVLPFSPSSLSSPSSRVSRAGIYEPPPSGDGVLPCFSPCILLLHLSCISLTDRTA
jgi:hypothetical protein